MSFYSLRGINLNFCRHVFILTQRPDVRLLPSIAPVNVSFFRRSHDVLYEMVKKRTLEARTKMNDPNYQKHNASQESSSNPSKSAKPLDSSSSTSSNNSSSSRTQIRTNLAKKDADVMYNNVRILSADNCNAPGNLRKGPAGCEEFAAKTGSCEEKGAPAGKGSSNDKCDKKSNSHGSGPSCPGRGGGGGGSGDGPSGNKLQKALLLFLAAVGAGGLLFWLTRDSNEQTPTKEHKPCHDVIKEEKIIPKPSKHCPKLPKHVPYLLIGGGTAAFSAFRAIKSNDAQAKVLMITNESRKPYMRPPLSKELWYTAKSGDTNPDYRFKQWTGAERSIFFEPEEFFIDPEKLEENPNGGIAVAHCLTVRKIDPVNRKVYLNNDVEIGYDNCLIATGCSPKNLPVFLNSSPGVKERVMVYRTPEDFERLKRYADQKKSIMIVGNGFIGSELSCSLATYAKCKGGKIYQVYAESGNMSRVLPDYLSKWTTRKVQEQGVCVIPNASIRAAQRDENTLKITLNNGNTIITDVVVVCVGCDPNTSLAYTSGLEVHPELGGFVVNAELEARQNLFVAGDASCFYDPLLGRRRLEHHDHSVVSGRLAGENMVGKKKPYTHQSMFWSDLGPEIGYEAIGLVDSSLPTVGIFALSPKIQRPANVDNLTENRTQAESIPLQNAENVEIARCEDPEDSYGKGVIFYLKNEKVVGILLWNLFNRIGLARTIISQDKKYDDLNEVAKLFEIHS